MKPGTLKLILAASVALNLFAVAVAATLYVTRAEVEHRVDALLHLSPAPRVSMVLQDRVIASAAETELKARREGRRWLDRLTFVLGAGWAAAACAGVVAGVMLTTHMTADAQADAILYQASLMGVDDTEVLG